MEVGEVSVGPEDKSKKKFSPRVHEEVQRYLGERGISRNDLSEKQRTFVAQYIKGKQYAKRGLIIMILGTAIAMFMAFCTYKTLKSHAARLARMMPTHEVVVREDGTKKVVESEREIVEVYGKLHVLVGFVIGFFIFFGISTFSFAVRFFVQMHKRDEILEAFLPTAKSNVTSVPRSSTGVQNIR